MQSDRRPGLVLATVVALLLGYALSIRVPAQKGSLFSDEATYYMMAYSLAFDGDLRYEQHDLARVYEQGYAGGPSGLFLKRAPDTGRLYYAKAFAYSLAAAPLVYVLGDNGFFVLHALSFALLLGCGYAYLRRTLPDSRAALYALTYFVPTISFVYFFWLTPETFNLTLMFLAAFLWLYKEEPPGWPPGAGGARSGAAKGTRSGSAEVSRIGWLDAAWTDVAAAALFGVAAYSKPPNAIVAAFFFLWLAYRRRWQRLAVSAVAFAALLVALFGITSAGSGDWNYMGGDRKTFQSSTGYPLEAPGRTFDAVGIEMVTDIEDYKDRIPVPRAVAADLVYVFAGRNAGLLVYMFPAIMALLMFLGARERSFRGPHAFVLAAWAASLLAYMLVIQGNWVGGGGALGSRYFVTVYPLLFFLIPAGAGVLGAALAWIVGALFLSQILLNPMAASHDPAMHTKAFPFKLLPTELTLLNNLPFNVHPNARRVPLDPDGDIFVYFLDDNTHLREADTWGFWVKMAHEAEFVLRTQQPVRSFTLRIRNGPASNRVTARLQGERLSAELREGERIELDFTPGLGFPYGETFLYRFTVASESGFVPKFSGTGSSDFRELGVFVEVSAEYAVDNR